jgi:hypothetical protein
MAAIFVESLKMGWVLYRNDATNFKKVKKKRENGGRLCGD